MKFFESDIIVNDTELKMLVEDNNIPFKKKVFYKRNNSIVYKSCFISKDNIEFIEDNKYLKIYEKDPDVIKDDVYFIYSDGGSFNNGKKDKSLPMFGSTSTIILKNNKDKIFSKYDASENVTNNECEVTASLIGLRYLRTLNCKTNEKINVVLISDSQYLIKGINEWMDGWKKRNWKNNEGQPISNMKLWKEVEVFLNDPLFNIYTCWVRGHQDNNDSIISKMNKECDYYCNLAINDILQENNLPVRNIKNIL